MSGSTVRMIAAMARNGVMGKDGKLPWSIPEDLQIESRDGEDQKWSKHDLFKLYDVICTVYFIDTINLNQHQSTKFVWFTIHVWMIQNNQNTCTKIYVS